MKLVYFVLSKLKINKKSPYYSELVGAGYLGLCNAANNYEKNGYAFTTYAYKAVRCEILHELNMFLTDIPSSDCLESLFDSNLYIEDVEDKVFADEFLKDAEKILSKKQYKIFVDYISDKTLKDTSKTLNCSYSSVRWAKKKAVLKLRRKLKREGLYINGRNTLDQNSAVPRMQKSP